MNRTCHRQYSRSLNYFSKTVGPRRKETYSYTRERSNFSRVANSVFTAIPSTVVQISESDTKSKIMLTIYPPFSIFSNHLCESRERFGWGRIQMVRWFGKVVYRVVYRLCNTFRYRYSNNRSDSSSRKKECNDLYHVE